MIKDADYWIKTLEMSAHPEGGFFKELYRSEDQISPEGLPDRFAGARSAGTGIYFLLKAGQVSNLHRIDADELWHFYAGVPLTVHRITPQGEYKTLRLGPDPEAGQVFQGAVPAGEWFGASLDSDEGFALVGCTVSPGFEFSGFELAERAALCADFPQHVQIVEKLTPAP